MTYYIMYLRYIMRANARSAFVYTDKSHFELFREDLGDDAVWHELAKAFYKYLPSLEKRMDSKVGYYLKVSDYLNIERDDQFLQIKCKNHDGFVADVVWIVVKMYTEFFGKRGFEFLEAKIPFYHNESSGAGVLYADKNGFKAILWLDNDNPIYYESDFDIGDNILDNKLHNQKGDVQINFIPDLNL